MKNVLIRGTGTYIPPHKVYNDELDEHFEKLGLTAHNLMEHLGRRKRYFISEDENAITMCKNAIDHYVEKFKADLQEIEMLVVCTDTPEYLFPSNAMKLVGLYEDKLKNVKTAFDLNCNCTSLILGIDVVQKYMKASDIRNALVLGCFCISPIALWTDTVVYATFGDAAACVALTMEDNDEAKGFIDGDTFVDAAYHSYITYPKCGMSKVPLLSVMPNEKRLEWNGFNMDFIPEHWNRLARKVLERHALTPDDVDYYIFSQLSDAFNLTALQLLEVSEEKYFFLGKEYGYTGNTCPVLCLDRMWEVYAQPGKRIMICTVGAGYSVIVQLYEF